MSVQVPLSGDGDKWVEKLEEEEKEKKAKGSTTKLEIPVDMSRDNMVEKSQIFVPFFVVSLALVVAENILVAFPAEGIVLILQKLILAASTILFFVGLFITANNFPEDDELTGENEKYKGVDYFTKVLLMFDGEVQIEAAFLILGWACIFESPGLQDVC